MRNNDIQPISERLNPAVSALFFFLAAMISFVVIGPLIGTIIVMLNFDGDLMDLMNKLQDPVGDSAFKTNMFILQGSATGIGLILLPWVYIRFINGKRLSFLSHGRSLELQPVLVMMFSVIAFMVVNSYFIEWNSNISMPESMSGVEQWMRQSEDQAARLTEYMTTFDTMGQFLFALLVIGVLPSIGEELVFRGYLQRELGIAFNSPHLAIWLSAAIFSAIHMQFFGFVPRLLLGALFGYMYYWSGNLKYPMIAHFVVNGGQVCLLYMVQRGVTDIDMESNESFPIWIIILFSVITFGLLFYFRRTFRENS